MSGWSNLLNKTAYYKVVTGYTSGLLAYGTVQTCIATWENSTRTIKRNGGEEIMTTTEIISEDEIPEQALFWESLADSTDDSKARLVLHNDKDFDKYSGETMYTSWL